MVQELEHASMLETATYHGLNFVLLLLPLLLTINRVERVRWVGRVEAAEGGDSLCALLPPALHAIHIFLCAS
jgi:hypothetical protein